MDSRGHTSATLGVYGDERSIADILKDIGGSLQQIVRSEISLAKIELSESMRRARRAGITLAAGAILAIFAIGFVLLTVLFALEITLPAWLAALIVSVLVAIAAAAGISKGVKLFKSVQPPKETIRTAKEDLKWIAEQPRS